MGEKSEGWVRSGLDMVAVSCGELVGMVSIRVGEQMKDG